MVAGLSFSTLLCCVYLPARFLLLERIRKAATRAYPRMVHEERAMRLAHFGVDLGQGQRWIQTLAALSPILAGSAAGFNWVLK